MSDNTVEEEEVTPDKTMAQVKKELEHIMLSEEVQALELIVETLRMLGMDANVAQIFDNSTSPEKPTFQVLIASDSRDKLAEILQTAILG
jgi:hypothetical protein